LTCLCGFISVAELDISEASRLVVLVNGAPRTHDLTELAEGIMEILVSPVFVEAFDKDIAVLLTSSVHLFVERKCTTDFAVESWIPNVLCELASV
jgi:hypothetical protein